MHLSGLFIYPVKSLGGFFVSSADVDALGFQGDRRFLVVDAAGKFMTQRTHPKMALIATRLTAGELHMEAHEAGILRVSRSRESQSPLPSTRVVSVWSSEGLIAEDCGDEPAQWLSHLLDTPCRLVRIGPDFERPIQPHKLPKGGPGLAPGPQWVTFADALPFIVIGESSLADLNDRLMARSEDTVPMNRFRPNLVITGSPAFAEDTWKRFRIGDITFQGCGPSARCIITTTDQETAERGIEPLRTLADYRRDAEKPGNINFGQNLVHENKSGTVRVGDQVEVLL